MSTHSCSAFGLAALAAATCALAAHAANAQVTEDRAAIESLQARTMFALDWRNVDAYRAAFTEDAVIVSAAGEERGDAIGAALRAPLPESNDGAGWPARTRHSIANVVLDIDGDHANGRAYWIAMGDDNPERKAELLGYGHYEDEYVKTSGEWRIARREVFDETDDDRASTDVRPTVSFAPPPVVGDSYADNRAAIEDLQARYLFAMNWFDPAAYAGTFAPDGTVYMGTRVENGRDEIETVITDYREIILGHPTGADEGLRPPATRHAISNVIVDIDGDTARAWGYWNTFQNDNLERAPEIGNYGSYEDDLVKVDGLWRFTGRKVFNQMHADRVAPDELQMPIHIDAGPPAGGDVADDRAAIENLEARYIFALDWQNPDAYAATFAEDGELVSAVATAKGREAIRNEVVNMRVNDRTAAAREALRPFTRRHAITNLVLDIHGDHATARAYWTGYNNDDPTRAPYVESYGHYEDQLVKVNGEWLFARRHIYNEQRADRASSGDWPLDD